MDTRVRPSTELPHPALMLELTGRFRVHFAERFQVVSPGWEPSFASSGNFEATPIHHPWRIC